MSDFFRQLVARHQGNADMVQPWIPPRFATETDTFVSSAISWGAMEPGLEPEPEPAARDLPSPGTMPLRPVSPPIQPHSSVLPGSTPLDSSTHLETVTSWMQQMEHNAANMSEIRVLSVPERIAPPAIVPPAVSSIAPQVASAIGTTLSTRLPIEPSERPVHPPTHSFTEPLPTPPGDTATLPARSSSPLPPFSSPLPSITPIQSSLPLLQTPTIKINIGRVEIRALPASPASPPAPRRATPVQRPALSLDAYLQQRNRRQ